MSSRVDLPAPFGPTTPTAWPRGTARVTPVSTFSAPNRWCTSCTASRASASLTVPAPVTVQPHSLGQPHSQGPQRCGDRDGGVHRVVHHVQVIHELRVLALLPLAGEVVVHGDVLDRAAG